MLSEPVARLMFFFLQLSFKNTYPRLSCTVPYVGWKKQRIRNLKEKSTKFRKEGYRQFASSLCLERKYNKFTAWKRAGRREAFGLHHNYWYRNCVAKIKQKVATT
jgi:hypothetical protein